MALIDALHEKSGCGGCKDRLDCEAVELLNIRDWRYKKCTLWVSVPVPHEALTVQATAGVPDDEDYDDLSSRPGNTIGQPGIMRGLNRQMVHTTSTISNAPNVPVSFFSGCSCQLSPSLVTQGEGVHIR